jgi:hypothetical protein
MPIHLPAISRRNFLRRSLAAAAGLGIIRHSGLAKDAQGDQNIWALLSDTHLAADPSTVARGINMTDHLKQAVREVCEEKQRPGALLVSGDCAFNSGRVEDYAAFIELLKPARTAGSDIHLALGNHDHRERFWRALPEKRETVPEIADRQVALVKTPLVNWFILDSLETTMATPGLVGKPQLDWLAQTLDAHSKTPAIVVVHHNPGVEGNAGLKDTLAFFEVIRPRRQVKAYIYGHTHKWRVEKDNTGLHLINLPPVAYLFHSGDPAGWVRATIRKDGMELRLQCIDPTHKAHLETQNLSWRS